MHRERDGIRYSPSDLLVFLESEFAAWMERWSAERDPQGSLFAPATSGTWEPDSPTEDAQLLQKRGMEHERELRRQLEREGHTVETVGRGIESTRAAMGSGASILTRARLELAPFAGYADFLARVEGASRVGAHHYEPWDAKLAKSVQARFVVQLCAYAEMLEALQGRRPEVMQVVLGTGERVRLQVDRYIYYYAHLKRAFLAFQRRFDATNPPHPALSATHGRWSGVAGAMLAATDHVSGVANIRRSQMQRLERAGIHTMAALAASQGAVTGIQPVTLVRLRAQARLQIASRDAGRPLFELEPLDPQDPKRGLGQLPPASPLDIYFDLEGDPLVEGKLEYLFGVVYATQRSRTTGGATDAGTLRFQDWWALEPAAEKATFEAFVDWVWERWQRDPSLHIHHYGAYEVAAMRRLASKYGTREEEIDELLRREVFVDLYTVVRQGFVIGTPSYSLKDVERLFRDARHGNVKDATACIVAYQKWLESREPADWQVSPILHDIRDYNQVDCESTAHLAAWLRQVQQQAGIEYVAKVTRAVDFEEAFRRLQLEQALERGEEGGEGEVGATPRGVTRSIARAEPRALGSEENVAARETPKSRDPERARVRQLLEHMRGFHRREEKPAWWRHFDRLEMSASELYDDPDCLANLRRTPAPAQERGRARFYEYRFDPEQDTKLEFGDRVAWGRDRRQRARILTLELDAGRIVLELDPGAMQPPPDEIHLIPRDAVPADVLENAIAHYAGRWEASEAGIASGESQTESRAVDDFLLRRAPRLAGHTGGPIVPDGEDVVQALVRVARAMDATTLSIQGPPGTGKTWTAAQMLVALLVGGKRVGVMANSHKTILHLMTSVARELRNLEAGVPGLAGHARIVPLRPSNPHLSIRLVKVGGGVDAQLEEFGIHHVDETGAGPNEIGHGPILLGGTAWLFARPEMRQNLDYLCVDEAGQVSAANLVAAGQCARNILLVGDQMQLPQPTQGSHPEDSGKSALEYLLAGQPTVAPEFGVFLSRTWRLHPEICTFISEAIYEGRLTPHPSTAQQGLILGHGRRNYVRRASGIVWIPVEHEHNAQASDEEVQVADAIVHELLGLRWRDRDGRERDLQLRDILVVAPYNLQVRRLQRRLPDGARIGSVDRFQGLEAPVVLVSMCASNLEEAPRGVEFLLNRNRINVAVSRAQGLAIVVGSPALLSGRCTSLSQMELVNLFCRLEEYAARLPAADTGGGNGPRIR